MWKALGALLFKLLASVGAYFVVRKSGKDAQKLKDSQAALEHARRANEIDEYADGMSAGDLDNELRKYLRD